MNVEGKSTYLASCGELNKKESKERKRHSRSGQGKASARPPALDRRQKSLGRAATTLFPACHMAMATLVGRGPYSRRHLRSGKLVPSRSGRPTRVQPIATALPSGTCLKTHQGSARKMLAFAQLDTEARGSTGHS